MGRGPSGLQSSGPALVVGLGNPGAEYEATRHNVGAQAVSLLARRGASQLRSARAMRCLVSEVRIGGRRVTLAFPQTYMNDSGAVLAALLRRAGVEDLSSLFVLHDELDLPSGVVRLKVGGGTAGHNGLRSMAAHLHSLDFARVRIGIGRPPGRMDAAAYVLKAPRGEEREVLAGAVETAADAVEVALSEGVAAAMNRFNAA